MRIVDRTIPANSFERLNLPTSFVYARTLSGTLRIDGDNNQSVKLEQGDVAEYALQESVNLVNESGSALTIEILVGIGAEKFQKAPPSSLTVSGNSNLSTLADVTLTASTITLIAAANTARKSITVVSDPTNSANMRIGDAVNTGATRGALLQPGQSITLETTAAVYAYSASADTVSLVEA